MLRATCPRKTRLTGCSGVRRFEALSHRLGHSSLQEPFEVLVKNAIRKLQQPALECQALVYEELLRIAAMAAPKGM